MGNYGMYGFKNYNSKRGKNYIEKRNKEPMKTNNDYYGFVMQQTILLENLERSGNINNTCGLLPFAFVPRELRNTYTKKYFAIETFDILEASLNTMHSIPFSKYDFVTTNMVNSIPDENGQLHLKEDFCNTIKTRDDLTRGYLSNVIIAFCFECVLPTYLFNFQIYNDIIKTITSSLGFKSRAMIIRTDIANHRIMFIVSNVTEDNSAHEKYKLSFENQQRELYIGEDILLTKHGNVAFETLSNKIMFVMQAYINNLIRKSASM